MISRRTFLLTGGAITFAGATALYYRRDHFNGKTLTPYQAFAQAQSDQVTLIDIRRPEEWAQTGVPTAAYALDMRRADFIQQLDMILDGDRSRPVALICARGVRSNRMSARLTEAGFSNILDVPEGMLGSTAGPGWLARNLPVQNSG